jgi:hypothetical protein
MCLFQADESIETMNKLLLRHYKLIVGVLLLYFGVRLFIDENIIDE